MKYCVSYLLCLSLLFSCQKNKTVDRQSPLSGKLKMVKYVNSNDSTIFNSSTYFYDSTGRLIRKADTVVFHGSLQSTGSTEYIYEPGKVVAVTLNDTNQLTYYFQEETMLIDSIVPDENSILQICKVFRNANNEIDSVQYLSASNRSLLGMNKNFIYDNGNIVRFNTFNEMAEDIGFSTITYDNQLLAKEGMDGLGSSSLYNNANKPYAIVFAKSRYMCKSSVTYIHLLTGSLLHNYLKIHQQK